MSVWLWRLADQAQWGGWPPKCFWRWFARRLDRKYAPFCNGPRDVKSPPSGRLVAELTLLVRGRR